ncbi:hypothetical protein AVEN_172860-1 [Araneus ventricosus]|uniref:Uncharacterized protein n=1 Tax=Araneus ventricosus TaxID=182803 RepID=A0A4Y2UD46_ARAVE|nr:hypothetical protein AVEN_172860-1 [Araneus ventricosus]
MEFSRIFKRIPFPNRDIEKRVAFSGIIYLWPRSPNFWPSRQVPGSRKGRCLSLHTYPCKTPSPTIRLSRPESDITSLQQYCMFLDSEILRAFADAPGGVDCTKIGEK